MHVLLLIVSLLVAAAATLALLAWGTLLFRLLWGLRRRLLVRSGLRLPEPEGGWPKVSVVIPAHDEQDVIDACARSLRAQRYPNLEIIFVLDRCTDDTRARLRPHVESDERVVVIENEACPSDWAGKCNAARIGAERATGDWLLFTDADTEFDRDLVRATVAIGMHRGAPLVTLLSTLKSDLLHQLVAQPVACLCLIKLFPTVRVTSDRPSRWFANGQFMLFRRDWYERIDGHTGVKDELLEDLAFARAVGKAGGRTEVLLAQGMLRVSMYDSLGAFAEGWRRIFTDAAHRRPRRLRKLGRRVFALGVVLPAAQAAAIAFGLWLHLGGAAPGLGAATWRLGVAATIVQIVALTIVYPLSGAPRWAMIFFPVGSWQIGRILFDAARRLDAREPIVWGGRSYVPLPREGHEQAGPIVGRPVESGGRTGS